MAAHSDVTVSPRQALFGRAPDLHRALAWLRGGERLVTLVGPPGVGKTSLAREVASMIGAPICDLTSAHDEAGLRLAVARTLGIHGEGAFTPEQLMAALAGVRAGEPSVLVLDDFEHLVPGGVAIVADWLEQIPTLALLVTSRVRLGHRMELAQRVTPLSLPEPTETDASALLESDAVRLFVERARRIEPDRTLGEADLHAVRDLVCALDGLPLAIELAAARSAVASPRTICELLDGRFEVLSGSAEPARSLERAIAWSYELLSDESRRALEACTVFEGSFDLAAAQAVLHSTAAAALRDLQVLYDASLLRSWRDGEGNARYAPWVSVAEWVRARVGRAELEGPRARHAAHYLARLAPPALEASLATLELEESNLSAVLARSLSRQECSLAEGPHGSAPDACGSARPGGRGRERAPRADGSDRSGRADRSGARTEGPGVGEPILRQALSRQECSLAEGPHGSAPGARTEGPGVGEPILRQPLSRGASCDALRAALALEPLRSVRGPLDTHVRALRDALERSEEDPGREGGDIPRALLVLGLRARGRALSHLGQLEAAEVDLAAAVRSADDDLARGPALRDLGTLLRQRGTMDGAMRALAEARAMAERVGDARAAALALAQEGILAKERGDLDRAHDAYVAAIEALDAASDARAAARVRCDLGALHQERRAFDDARACFEHARAALEGGRDRLEALVHSDLGCLALEVGDAEGAEAHLARAVALFVRVGDRRYAALFRATRAAALAALGREQDARSALIEAERALEGDVLFLATARIHRGHVALAELRRCRVRGDDTSAARAEARAAAALASAPGPGGEPLSRLSDDVRFAVRALDAALAREQGDTLVAHVDLEWVLTPDGQRIDLARSALLRRLARALIDARGPLGAEALIAAGWPGERIGRDSASNRLAVALAKLRALGFRDLLVNDARGWAIDPRVRVVRAP